jgi:nucleotide-binding universal stress UspA family protein
LAYKKIRVALDGSELAEAALPHAQKLASDTESEIMLLRVSINPVAEFSFSDPHIADKIIKAMESRTLLYLQSRQRTRVRYFVSPLLQSEC